MVRKVYRVLDRPYALFGLRGRYVIVFLAALGVGMAMALLVGSVFGMMAGAGLLIVLMILAYLAIMVTESFFSERDIARFVWSRRIRQFVTVRPKPLRSQWK